MYSHVVEALVLEEAEGLVEHLPREPGGDALGLVGVAPQPRLLDHARAEVVVGAGTRRRVCFIGAAGVC